MNEATRLSPFGTRREEFDENNRVPLTMAIAGEWVAYSSVQIVVALFRLVRGLGLIIYGVARLLCSRQRSE